MKKFKVEIAEVKYFTLYCKWDRDYFKELIEADSEEEAIEIARNLFLKNGKNPEKYFFRAMIENE